MSGTPRLLVVDAYDAPGRKALTEAGCTRAGELYRDALLTCLPDASVEIFAYGESTEIPGGVESFDGIVWTGSSLTIYRLDDGPVRKQIDLAREGYDKGVPQFGSCYAAQMAVMAAGGECARNPKGREFGMQTFNQSLLDLFQDGLVEYEDALLCASTREEFKLNAQGMFTGTDAMRVMETGEFQ